MSRPIHEVRCAHCGEEIAVLEDTVEHKWGKEYRISFPGTMCDCFWEYLPRRVLDDILEEAKDSYDDSLRDEMYEEAMKTVDEEVRNALVLTREDNEELTTRLEAAQGVNSMLQRQLDRLTEEFEALKKDVADRPFLL